MDLHIPTYASHSLLERTFNDFSTFAYAVDTFLFSGGHQRWIDIFDAKRVYFFRSGIKCFLLVMV